MQHRLSANYSSVRDNIRLAVAAILGSNLAFSLSDAAHQINQRELRTLADFRNPL